MHALSVSNISFGYSKNVPTLRNVSLSVTQGEFFSLFGPNGSGKTTLLRLLNRIFVPHSGTIHLSGKDISGYTRGEIAKRIALIPQETSVQFPFTVMEIVLMGRAPHTHGRIFESEYDRTIAEQMLTVVDMLHLADHPVTTLSGGERQRAFIARALAQQPQILLMDEPNAHLDISHQVDIFRLVRTLNRENGLTVIAVSHDLNLASAFSDRAALLVCGSLTAMGTPSEVLTEHNIREAFRTTVLVDQHPSTGSPRITLTT